MKEDIAGQIHLNSDYITRIFRKETGMSIKSYIIQQKMLAARQFLKFSSYLFLPESGVFSHVYDLDRKCATGIPWGRGNGWVLFSLAYFLDGLTEELENYNELMKLFLTLSGSYRRLQGGNGLWHQMCIRDRK